MSTTYYASAPIQGVAQFRQVPFAVGIKKSPVASEPIGLALEHDKTTKGIAIWRLIVRRAPVPGFFTLADGTFQPLEWEIE
jgi:hypothetical protein